MDKSEIMKKYNSGDLSSDDLILIERYLEEGVLDISEFEDLATLQSKVAEIGTDIPSRRMRERFTAMLAAEKDTNVSPIQPLHFLGGLQKLQNWLAATFAARPQVSLAFAASLVIIGFFIGMLIGPSPKYDQQLVQLNSEIGEMKELMMLSLLEKASASDRLKAVSMSGDMEEANTKVILALTNTLNNDENVNVRLAALEALTRYSKQATVRETLIQSIEFQDSPLVQIALAETMAAMQERGAIDKLKEIINEDSTPEGVRKQLQESIDLII